MTIGLDTNILVRYITNDDKEQADKVEKLFKAAGKEVTFSINHVVIAELDWVLTHVYKYPQKAFLKVIDQLFETKNIVFSSPVLVKEACKLYINGKADFSDCYLGVMNEANNCQTTYTFDKKAARLSCFTRLD